MKSFTRRHAVLSTALIIFVLAFIARSGALKQYVSPDEPSWVWRSIHFSLALAQGDWAGTAQIGHPGVTTMWLGSLGVLLKCLADPVSSAEAIQWLSQISTLSPDNAEAFKRLGVFLTYTRLPVMFVNALGVVLIFWLVRRLWGQRVGVMAGLLFALDPFVAGLSGLLHVDGLLTTFSVLSVLAMLNGLYRPFPLLLSVEGRRVRGEGWFALAGAFAGLAFLSKSPGIFLSGFVLLALLFAVVTRRLPAKRALLCLLSFVIVHWSFVVLLYPAMWVQPIETLSGIFGLASFLSVNAVRPTFFDGQYQLNHGASFYPMALLFRLTPIVMLGLVIAVVAIARGEKQPQGGTSREAGGRRQPQGGASREAGSAEQGDPAPCNLQLVPCLWLLVFAVLFIIFITPVAKKYDRYMLPAEAMLILAAAWGIGQIRSVAVRTLVAGGAAAMVMVYWPYLLMHYNPLLGGVAEAEKHFAVGWGEGLGAAANWINQQPDGLQSAAATTAVPSFAPIFSGLSRNTYDRDLELSDYYVITLSEQQLIPEFYADLERRGDIVQVLRTGTVDGAWVLRNKQAQLQAQVLQQANPQTDAIVALIDLPVSRAYHGAAQLVTLRRDVTSNELEQILNDLSTRYRRLWFTWSGAASLVVQQQMRDWLEQTATPAEPQDFGDFGVYDLKPGQIGRLEPFRVQFGGNLALVDVVPVVQGRRGTIETRWQLLAPIAAPYTVTLQLIDQAGAVWKTIGDLIQDQEQRTAQQWPLGRAVDQSFRFTLPDEAPPGNYDVRVSIDQSDGTRAGLFSAAGIFSGTAPVLASFEAPLRDQALGLLSRTPAFPFEHRWDDEIEIVGFDSGPGVVINGDPWPVDVLWRSMSDHLPNLGVIWEVRNQNNQKMFSTRLPLSAYPTALWREGEIIGARYVLRYPVDLQPADYHVSIGVTGPDGQLLNGGMFTPFDVRLLHRDRSFDQPHLQHPLSVAFDDPAIQLVGADFPTQTLQAGDPLPVTLYWQAGTTTQDSYSVFVHLETLNGTVIAQIDSQPQGGGMPTVSWATGQVVVDPYPLSIPPDTPPGAYRIVVGLYNSLDGMHLIDTRTGEGKVVLEPAVIVQ